MIDLMFDTEEEAEAFRASLRDMCEQGDSPMRNPRAQTVKTVE
jgi:hypothetical protein